MNDFIILTQQWHDFDRVIIIDAQYRGSVSLELYKKQQDFGSTAWLYALYVDESSRSVGIGRLLLQVAEDAARERGHKTVALDWALKDSPAWVLDWYVRSGYDEKQFDGRGRYSLLVKDISL